MIAVVIETDGWVRRNALGQEQLKEHLALQQDGLSPSLGQATHLAYGVSRTPGIPLRVAMQRFDRLHGKNLLQICKHRFSRGRAPTSYAVDPSYLYFEFPRLCHAC